MPLLALQMEEGSHKSRVWGPLDAGNNSVYNQQENLNLDPTIARNWILSWSLQKEMPPAVILIVA